MCGASWGCLTFPPWGTVGFSNPPCPSTWRSKKVVPHLGGVPKKSCSKFTFDPRNPSITPRFGMFLRSKVHFEVKKNTNLGFWGFRRKSQISKKWKWLRHGQKLVVRRIYYAQIEAPDLNINFWYRNWPEISKNCRKLPKIFFDIAAERPCMI